MNAEKRNTGKIIAIVVGILVVLCLCLACVAGVAYWQRDKWLGLLGLAPQTQAAKMMPADTPFYLGMSLNLQNQAGYQNLKKLYLDNPEVKAALDRWMADFEEETSINFDNDIKPWLGTEAALAISSVTDLEDMSSAQILLAVSTRDVKASEAFLQKVRDQAAADDRPFEQGEHAGVTYWYQPAETEFDTPAYAALFNNFVVAATSEEALVGAIDRVQAKSESLADNQNFQAVTGALPDKAALFTFVDWAAIADVALQEAPVELETEQLSQLEALQGIGMAAILQPDGLQIDAAIRLDVEKLPESTRSALNRPASPNEVIQRIPADAIGFFNSYDLHSMWQQVRESLAANPDFEQQLEDVESETGLNLDEDIFSWMTGEYTMVVTEAQPADASAPPLGGYLLIGTDNIGLAQEKVTKLVNLLGEEMGVEFQSQTIAGHEMQVIADPATQSVMGGYGFWDNYFVAGYLEEALEAAFAASDNAISASPHFKAVSARLPDKNYGYFYIDIDAVQHLAESQMSEFEREDYQSNVQPFVEPLRAFGVAGGPAQEGIQTATMFLLITEQ